MDRVYVATSTGLGSWTYGTDGWSVQDVRFDHALECFALDTRRQDRLLCGTRHEGVYRSSDGGETFDLIGMDGTPVTSLAIDPSNPDVVLAGTEPSALFRSIDGGDSWRQVGGLTSVPSAAEWSFPPRPDSHHVRSIAIAPRDPDRWYVGIESGALVVTTDAGSSWMDRPPGARRDNHTLAIHPAAPRRVYAAAGDGYAESRDAGMSWDVVEDGRPDGYVWSVAVDPGDVDLRLISAAKNAGHAHRLETAKSHVYRRRGNRSWTRLDGTELPGGDGVLRSVIASGSAPGEFVAASNRGCFVT